jgi:hypothetical protein
MIFTQNEPQAHCPLCGQFIKCSLTKAYIFQGLWQRIAKMGHFLVYSHYFNVIFWINLAKPPVFCIWMFYNVLFNTPLAC